MTRVRRLAILLASAAIATYAQQFDIVPNGDSRIELRVHKTGLYRGKTHVFSFPDYSGRLTYDVAMPLASRIELTLDAAAIKLEDEWLSEGDFKEVQEYAVGKDMLEAAKYPEIRFTSNEIRPSGEGRFEVRGTLTIHGVSKPVLVQVVREDAGDGRPKFTGTSVVKLTEFGLKPPKAALGLIGTKNEMDLSFTLVVRP